MYNILIVDDEEITCHSLKARIEKLFETTPKTIYEAYNSEDAIKLTEKVNIDIVITDIKMPGMNGIELIKKIIKNSLACRFLVVSGYGDYEYVRKAFLLGIDDYLLKPISSKDLKDKLEDIFKKLQQKKGQQILNGSNAQQSLGSTSSVSTVVEIAKKYVQENDIKNINLTTVSNHVSMNYTYFSELFKKETGVTFSQYLMDVKMSKAVDLLKNPCNTVQQIAYELGYENPKHFSRAFKNYFGISPTDFKNSENLKKV